MAVKLSDLIKCYENSSGEDFSVWVDKLELVAKLQEITDLTTFLPLFLAGDAFAVYKQLSASVKKDFTKLKKALLTAFSVNNFSAYEQLRMRTLLDGETVDVYIADLQRLVALIGQSDAEPLLKCAFMAGLPHEVATQLKSVAAVENLGLTNLVARARMMISSSMSQPATCAATQRQRQGEQQLRCYYCSGPHLARSCRSKGQSSRRDVRCYNCNELGHMRRQCTQPQQQGNANGAAFAPDALPK